jgi:VanZ family protein
MDWVLHALEYGFLAVCLLEYLYESHHSVRRFAFTITFPVLFCGTIGGLNELWQAQIPQRAPSWADFVANIIGATIATLVFVLKKRPWLAPRKEINL